MRTPVFALMLVIGLAAAPALAVTPGAPDVSATAFAQQPPQQQPPPKVDIDIDTDRGGDWYRQPVWIAVGALAVVVVLALLVMAGRGGGTTVVKG